MFGSTMVAVAETSYIGRLGTVPLAAIALVFPFAMLTQMMSAGAMGGGVSSAISRALGAGNRDRAATLALHAAMIGACGGHGDRRRPGDAGTPGPLSFSASAPACISHRRALRGVGGPVIAYTARLLMVAIGGWWLASINAPAWTLFALVGAAMIVLGLGTAASVRLTRWGK
jgi:MatE